MRNFHAMSGVAIELLHSALELLLPDVCRICGTLVAPPGDLRAVCADCLAGVRFIGLDVCCRCGAPFTQGVSGSHHCSACLRKEPVYDRAVSITEYDGPVRELLHSLKYRSDTRVIPALAAIYELAGEKAEFDGECIIPVPLFRKRLRSRGLNQSLYLARILFPDKTKMIRPAVLERVRNTAPQTGLDGTARRKNLSNAFRVTDLQPVFGRNIILVDDVYTTGSTVEECSKILKRAGAVKVYVVTFSRVIPRR